MAMIEAHKAMLAEVFELGDDPSEWSSSVRKKIRTRSVPSHHRLDRVPAREEDDGLLTDSHVREIANAHRLFVDAIWARMSAQGQGCDELETISVEKAAEFWPVLYLSIEVPYWRWTAEHYHNRMEHAYEVMRGRSSEGEHFDEEPLSIRQANAVIRVFSRWMDADDVRLEVPNGHDELKRSDDGGYSWCENCGAVDGSEVRWQAARCERAQECPLRQLFAEDEFEDEDDDADDADDAEWI
jgi:hypothetical protein